MFVSHHVPGASVSSSRSNIIAKHSDCNESEFAMGIPTSILGR